VCVHLKNFSYIRKLDVSFVLSKLEVDERKKSFFRDEGELQDLQPKAVKST